MAPVEINDDYYAILEVSQTATADEINKSYRRLALLLHPDKNLKKAEATASFQLVSIFDTMQN
jgi:curved DNA-binding protein CbpA